MSMLQPTQLQPPRVTVACAATLCPPVAPVVSVVIRPLAVDTDTAGALIGRAPRTLANWRSAGTGPAYIKTDDAGGVVYLVADLEAWLEERRAATAARTPAAA
ncbi:hypothetical protein LK459_07605 [Gordonia otitidis]|uniref:hypothetical protein n=1 Tax=Gordonia otitidis TaxID=249058 RepID=UPI001D13F55B|nr:hypothetical protein [Gordonia otitidis]UEA60688.1 hypothetical protein LK459_07605 [Gordonia otitidis]